ncbi:MAG: multiprotein bridging factor aMBF1 [Thermofilaceae archaeon]
MRCELCGEEIRGKAYLGVVDRAELILCDKCVKRASKVYGPLGAKKQVSQAVISSQRTIRIESEKEEVVDDFADKIREARERAGFTRDTLAALLGTKVSVVRRLEEGSLKPTLEMARKLEKILKVQLIENVAEGDLEGGGIKTWEQTLGDVAEFKE